MVEMGWVGFSYQNLYIVRYYNYQTDISLFTSDCSHPVLLAAFRPLYQIMLLLLRMMIMTKLVI